MELLAQFVDILLHLDRYLGVFLHNYGTWIYLLLFLVVFAETGLVVTPFLPGDSLLFVTGALAATGGLDVGTLCALLIVAAILGDTVNYWIGDWFGLRLFNDPNARFLRREYLDRTHRFYERHGGKTIVIARFVPIIRTFAPFVAGVGEMTYRKFLMYNVLGALLWVLSFVFAGYYFGNLPFVKKNLTLVILVIIILSIMPGVIEYLRHRRERP
ncbi:MAG: DedA family protein [Gammaproteobacteria bacterium]|nr:MAG: DedA family protein [Gammaproteobacteria bacterium]